ncbi:MAG: 2-oxoacid:acceptor oxidoreductase subunit alpha [Pseudomonadales bacterium]|nr:2-oxoacid:acceptor oxidoreductase subunit alpha [Pseudomonadales bacterium]
MNSTTFAIVGSGGAGIVSLGEMVLKSAAAAGYYGLMRKSFGPQIRGGESAAIIRLASQPVGNFDGTLQVLFVLDWNNFDRFGDEIPVTPDTLVISDTAAGQAPEGLAAISQFSIDFTAAADSAGSSKANMAMLGLIGTWLQCSTQQMETYIKQRLTKFPEEVQSVSVTAMLHGAQLCLVKGPNEIGDAEAAYTKLAALPLPQRRESKQTQTWIATGNQLAGLGALEAGIRFVAAYPITPASDCLEWIANHIESVDGHLVQAEDELSAINMVIGAGYSGVPSMTATSGPGLALMTEAMGLAVASETPVVVVNVMRGGPSTGIPTKSEQSDLNIALYGLHGDAPHLVLSALGIEDCFTTTAWAVWLSHQLQTLAIVLSDQFVGQSSKVIDVLPACDFFIESISHANLDSETPYLRYLDSESGVSQMAVPGDKGCMYTADGLEHGENAVPSPKAIDHQKQLDKRQRKLTAFNYGDLWGEVHGTGAYMLICWGSVHATALEAQVLLESAGIDTKLVSLRLISPFPEADFLNVCSGIQAALVIEQNHQGQLFHYLQGLNLAGLQLASFAKPGPSLITPQEIFSAVNHQLQSSDLSAPMQQGEFS